MLEPWGERGYEFRHALLAEAVTDDLLPPSACSCTAPAPRRCAPTPALGTSADLARHALAGR